MHGVRERTGLEHIVVTNIKEYFSPTTRILFTVAKEKKDGHRVPVAWNENTHAFATLASEQSRPQLPEVGPDDLAVLQYTGGTTGVAKGAMLTHRNLVANTLQVRAWDSKSIDGHDVILTVLPLFHVYALTVAMSRGLYAGCLLVLLPRYELKELLKAIAKYRPTVFPGVPTLYNAIAGAKEIGHYDLSSIRSCISGSAGLPGTVQKRFESLTHGHLVEGYGLTEASPVTHCNPFHDHRKEGSIGLPFPDTDVRIVDLETGNQELPIDETGEIAVKGPQVMKGYWNRPDESAAVLRDGWLLTGDMGRMDEDGFFYVVDRQERHGHCWGLQRLPSRGGRSALPAPKGGRSRGGWPAGRAQRRKGQSLCRAES